MWKKCYLQRERTCTTCFWKWLIQKESQWLALGHLIVKVYILGLYPSCRSSWESLLTLDFSPHRDTDMLGTGGNLCTYPWMGRHWSASKDDKRSLPASFIQLASVSGDWKRFNKDRAFMFLNSAC